MRQITLITLISETPNVAKVLTTDVVLAVLIVLAVLMVLDALMVLLTVLSMDDNIVPPQPATLNNSKLDIVSLLNIKGYPNRSMSTIATSFPLP